MLDISKIESGKVEIFLSLASTRETIRRWSIVCRASRRTRTSYLRAEFADDVPEVVLCDVPKVQQIVDNLVGNAVKFTDQGGVSVEVGADGKQWQIRVRDTGIGMPDNAAETHLRKIPSNR